MSCDVDKPTVSFVVPVFNSSEQAKKLAARLTGFSNIDKCEIIFVDDGSTDALVSSSLPESIKLVSLQVNRGRAIARNEGINKCTGEYIHFLDVDCIPADDYITKLLEQTAKSIDVVFGHLEFQCDDIFYQNFENDNQLVRAKGECNWELVQSSACLLVKKDLVLAIEGFSKKFNRYGFEDRDFLIRLKQRFPNASFAYVKALTVYHKDELTLDSFLSKFYASGKYSAPILRKAHPIAYSQSAYAKVDVNTSNIFSKIPKFLQMLFITITTPVLKGIFHLSPDTAKLKVLTFKALKGLAFLKGTINEGK
ncbi:glycosyltransferase family 2 protein [Alteromonadaceae bacterium BrNp21-10]|nr:glycosyltransferase family 2 protein [Alteromonadaceae bacterium BrNp21-10]